MIALAFDPGSRLSAWALLESRGVAPKPIAITLLEKGMIQSTDVAIEILLNYGISFAPDVIAIETIAGYAFAATSARGGGQVVVKALLETKGVEEKIRGLCRHRGTVVDVTAAQWRKSVCGKANARGPLIKAKVMQFVHGVKKSNPHVRDAIGAGVAVIWGRGGMA